MKILPIVAKKLEFGCRGGTMFMAPAGLFLNNLIFNRRSTKKTTPLSGPFPNEVLLGDKDVENHTSRLK